MSNPASPSASDVPESPPRAITSSPKPLRSRSVQFSMSTSPRTRSHDQDLSSQQRVESSADEITPIAGRERGESKSYDTTSNRNVNEARGPSKDRRTTARRRESRSARRSEEEMEDGGGWWRSIVDKYGSIELDNKGSVARDHLALGCSPFSFALASSSGREPVQMSLDTTSAADIGARAERTFLAWLRTSLAFASIGIAITQLFRLNTTLQEREGRTPSDSNSKALHLRQLGKPLGATFLGIAMVVLLVGGRRYFESQYWIIRGKFPASRGSIFLITFISVALIVSSMVIVCVIGPTIFEP